MAPPSNWLLLGFARRAPSRLGLVLVGRVRAALAERAEGTLALLLLGAVQHQDSVEVVDLVLDHAGLESGRLQGDRLTADVDGARPDEQGPLHVHDDAREAEAALLGGGGVLGAPLDLRVDEDRRSRLPADLKYQ